jgi:NAD(P)-dependent dehydrogenase (short-subunit alcohol dehydrogenase family)
LSSQLRTRSTRTQRPIEFRAELVKTIPLGRVAETHELSDVITFLATAAAGYVNGAVIHVDGGRTAV